MIIYPAVSFSFGIRLLFWTEKCMVYYHDNWQEAVNIFYNSGDKKLNPFTRKQDNKITKKVYYLGDFAPIDMNW